jgi:hypothetical protein
VSGELVFTQAMTDMTMDAQALKVTKPKAERGVNILEGILNFELAKSFGGWDARGLTCVMYNLRLVCDEFVMVLVALL